jgi:ankyrin repeat protein
MSDDSRLERGRCRAMPRASIRPRMASIVGIFLGLMMLRSGVALAANPSHIQSPTLQTGDLHALVVGVSTYRDPKIPKLQFAATDAKAFGEFLKTQEKVFKHIRVTFLLNEKATKAEVEKYLFYTLPRAGKNDTVILFFSGHGAYDPMRPKEFLFLTHDSEPDFLRATAVKMSGLDFLHGVDAERVLIIADACYAGGFSDMRAKSVGPTFQSFLSEVGNSSGRAIITSGTEEQLSWEVPSLHNSVFTHNLIEGLEGKADKDHDGVVTLNEAYEYAYNTTRQATKGHQHPQFEGKIVGGFPLSYVGPPVPASELKKQLMLAAKDGQAGQITRLLNFGLDVNTRDDENNTPLIIAAGNGHAEALKALLAVGADVDARNQQRTSALSAACSGGHLDAAGVLVKAGASLAVKNVEGFTPLALACRRGQLDVVKLLLSAQADIKSRTNGGKTPLILAAGDGHIDVVKLLVDQGADLDAKDLEGATAVAEAARTGHSDIVLFLIDKGTVVNAASNRFLDKQLILATLRNDLSRARELLTLGASVDALTDSGDTVLALAAGLGHQKLIECFLQRGATVNMRSRSDRTALMIAARNGRLNVAERLLKGGAYVDSTDKEGSTALMEASAEGHRTLVNLLLSYKADANARNGNGRTSLISASQQGHADVVKVLISGGALVNAADSDGDTALMVSARSGHAKIVKLLCESGADVNARNVKGATALMLGARNGYVDVVTQLLRSAADPFIQDWEGKTAFVLASESGRQEIAKALSAHRKPRSSAR